jgi:hypothetical protein
LVDHNSTQSSPPTKREFIYIILETKIIQNEQILLSPRAANSFFR